MRVHFAVSDHDVRSRNLQFACAFGELDDLHVHPTFYHDYARSRVPYVNDDGRCHVHDVGLCNETRAYGGLHVRDRDGVHAHDRDGDHVHDRDGDHVHGRDDGRDRDHDDGYARDHVHDGRVHVHDGRAPLRGHRHECRLF